MQTSFSHFNRNVYNKVRLCSLLGGLSLFFTVACEPAPPCMSETTLEGQMPPSQEAELKKVANKSFEASCVIESTHGKIRHGFHKTWYPGGRALKSEHLYDGGILNGEYTLYFSDGTIRETGSYRFGLKHGRYKSFHRNGKIHMEGMYQDGKKNGDFVVTSSNGTHIQKGPYFLDLKHGKWSSEYLSLNGRKISLLSFYHYGQASVSY